VTAGSGDGVVPGAPSDNESQVAILSRLAAAGYAADFRAVDDGSLVCGACGRPSPADRYFDVDLRRMEGASDPDDMTAILSGRCPSCGAGGTAVLAFGPTASEADAAVLLCLDR
jgi:hypothetical protein